MQFYYYLTLWNKIHYFLTEKNNGSREIVKTLADNRKSHHPIETRE